MNCHYCKSKLEKNLNVCPHCNTKISPARSFLRKLSRTDELLAATCLSAMILIVLAQIILRNVFQTGISGADSLVRHLVLWVVFLGAGIAAKDSSHIHIDFLPRFLSPGIKRFVDGIVGLFSICICFVLVYAAYSFVSVEYESGLHLALFNIPVWIAEVIIPAGYVIIAFHLTKNCFIAVFGRKETK